MPDLVAGYAPAAAATISALVSAGVAWFTARRSVRTEIDKLKLGVQQKLLEQLVAARLTSYPELYFLISELVKVARAPSTKPGSLRDLLERVNLRRTPSPPTGLIHHPSPRSGFVQSPILRHRPRSRCHSVCPLWRPPTPDRHAARSRGHPEDPRAPRPLPLGAESRPGPT